MPHTHGSFSGTMLIRKRRSWLVSAEATYSSRLWRYTPKSASFVICGTEHQRWLLSGDFTPSTAETSSLPIPELGRALTRTGESLAGVPRPGGDLLVPLADEVGRCIYFTGDYDRKLTWLCRKLARPGDITFDIGANLGLVTLTLAKCVGPRGQVHAFEPNPILQDLIQKTLDKNSASNVVLHRTALGSNNEELILFVPNTNSGQGSFKYHSHSPHSSSYQCSVKRLSDIVKQHQITTIRLMKIDVEGFENEVLLGGVEVLRDIRPDAIRHNVDMEFGKARITRKLPRCTNLSCAQVDEPSSIIKRCAQ